MFEATADKPAPTAEAPETNSGAPKAQTFEELSNMADQFDGNLDGAESAAKGKSLDPQVAKSDPADDDEFADEEDDSDEEEGESQDDEFTEDSTEEGGEDSDDEEEVEPDNEKVFLEQKVNGKVKKFTEKEVRQIIASGAHTLERAQQVDAYKAQVEEQANEYLGEIQRINSELAPVWKAVEENNITEAITLLASRKGTDKLQARRALVAQVAPVIYKRLGLTPQEVNERLQQNHVTNRLLDLQEEKDWMAERAKMLEESSKPKALTPEEEVNQTLAQVRMEHGIGKQELSRVLEFIEKNKGTDAKVTPEYISRVTLMMRAVDKSVQAIRAVRPALVTDQKFIDKVRVKAQQNPDWTVDKLARWVDKKARERATTQKAKEMTALQKDISGKALKNGKSGFENPSAGQNKAQRFDEIDPDSFGKLP